MKTSKYLALGLSVALALSLVSCGRGQQTQEPKEPKQGTQQTEPVTSEPSTQPIETSQVLNQQTQQVPEESKAPEEENKGDEEGNTDDVTGDTNTGENDTLGENEYFTPVNEIVYATGTVNIRSGPSVDTEKVGSLNRGDSVTRTGIGTGDYAKWSRVQLSDGREMFIATSYLSTAKPSTSTQGSTQTTKPTGGTQGSTQTPPSSGTGDTLAGEPNNGGGTGTTDSSGLTPAEQAIRDKFLKDNQTLNGGNGTHTTEQDMDEMLQHYFGN